MLNEATLISSWQPIGHQALLATIDVLVQHHRWHTRQTAVEGGSLLFQSYGGAICDYEEHGTTSTAKFRVIQVNTYHSIGSYS